MRAQFSSALRDAASPWKSEVMERARRFFTSIGCSLPAETSAWSASTSDCLRSVSSTQYFHIRSSEMDMSLPYISAGGSLMPMALPKDLDIFWTPSKPSKIGVIKTICGF